MCASSNILFTDSNEVRITDFGVATLSSSSSSPSSDPPHPSAAAAAAVVVKSNSSSQASKPTIIPESSSSSATGPVVVVADENKEDVPEEVDSSSSSPLYPALSRVGQTKESSLSPVPSGSDEKIDDTETSVSEVEGEKIDVYAFGELLDMILEASEVNHQNVIINT